MFWFIFVPIVLFIIFLIALLISSRSQTGMRPSRPTETKRTKRKERTKKQPKPRREEIIAQNRALKEERTKLKERVAQTAALKEAEAPAVTVAIEKAEEPFILEDDPFVPETIEAQDNRFFDVPSRAEEEVSKQEVEDVYVDVEKVHTSTPTTVIPEVEEASAEVLPNGNDEIAVGVVTEEDDYHYAPFDHSRTMEEFGLSREDADDFIVELIQQIETEMPALETAVETRDNKRIEVISHMIKGSATNLGTGGAADVLIDFNTYMKMGSEPAVIAMHMRHLHRALGELKEQFQS